MKIKIADAIRRADDKSMAKIIGSLIVCQIYGISADDAVKLEYKKIYNALKKEIDISEK